MKRYLSLIALWLALWLPWLYVGVFAYTTTYWGYFDVREHGWPYRCTHTEKDLPPRPATPARLLSLDPSMLAVNLLVSVVIASALTIVCRKWFAAIRRRGFRFRLSTLLILVGVVSFPLAGWRYLDDEYPSDQLLLDTIAETLANGGGSAYMKPFPLSMWLSSSQVNAMQAMKLLMKNDEQLPAELREPFVKCLTDDDPSTRFYAFRVVQQTDLSGPDIVTAIKQMMRMEIPREQYDEANALLSTLESSESNSTPR